MPYNIYFQICIFFRYSYRYENRHHSKPFLNRVMINQFLLLTTESITFSHIRSRINDLGCMYTDRHKKRLTLNFINNMIKYNLFQNQKSTTCLIMLTEKKKSLE
jgi:hypothetical protein